MTVAMNRRSLLAGTGALVVFFSLKPVLGQEAALPAPEKPKLPGSLDENRFLDGWIRIDAEGKITVFTGKAELGQGIKTALIQVSGRARCRAKGHRTGDGRYRPHPG
jgi:nicotinate dehydrogenase subunit B